MAEDKKLQSDRQLVERIRRDDKGALEELFFKYYNSLCVFAFKMIRSNEQAEDIVQEIFYTIWKRRKEWHIRISLKAYLFRAVRNHALNYIQKNNHYRHVRNEFARETDWYDEEEPNGLNQEKLRLVDRIWEAVYKMAPRRQSVFILHQKYGLSYKEIAEVLNIKSKTVENHMGFALNEIRESIDIDLFEIDHS